jgi:transcription elongation factor Elf1
LIDALYEALCHFRRAVNENSNTGTDAALSEISTVIQKLYDLGERYEKTQPEIKNKCTSFVNIYNSFVDAYTKFAMANRSELQTQIYSAAVNSNFQELLKLSLDDNYTSTNIVKQKIHTSLESLYNKLCDFRYSVNASNTHSINSSLEGVADAIQQVFSIAERYSISHPDICVKCTEIVDQYNSFITAYRAFLIEYQQGNNARTEYLNTTVNMHYRKLIDDILDALH